jgi:transposase
VILFEDETGFSLHPKLGRMWVKKGTQPYVYTRSEHNKRLNIFGWVDPVNGLHGMMKWIKGDTKGFLNLLKKIVYRFKGKIIDLWVDKAPWHKGERIKMFLMKYSKLHINYLPPYHPELNYQEILWRTLRYEETTNSFFDIIEHLEMAIFKRSQRWKPQKIKSLCKLI